jgi:hypothetical protein
MAAANKAAHTWFISLSTGAKVNSADKAKLFCAQLSSVQEPFLLLAPPSTETTTAGSEKGCGAEEVR